MLLLSRRFEEHPVRPRYVNVNIWPQVKVTCWPKHFKLYIDRRALTRQIQWYYLNGYIFDFSKVIGKIMYVTSKNDLTLGHRYKKIVIYNLSGLMSWWSSASFRSIGQTLKLWHNCKHFKRWGHLSWPCDLTWHDIFFLFGYRCKKDQWTAIQNLKRIR